MIFLIRVRNLRLHNLFSSFLLVYFIRYMFRSYGHLQEEAYSSEINTTDNGLVFLGY
jgi:hypothetical protein